MSRPSDRTRPKKRQRVHKASAIAAPRVFRSKDMVDCITALLCDTKTLLVLRRVSREFLRSCKRPQLFAHLDLTLFGVPGYDVLDERCAHEHKLVQSALGFVQHLVLPAHWNYYCAPGFAAGNLLLQMPALRTLTLRTNATDNVPTKMKGTLSGEISSILAGFQVREHKLDVRMSAGWLHHEDVMDAFISRNDDDKAESTECITLYGLDYGPCAVCKRRLPVIPSTAAATGSIVVRTPQKARRRLCVWCAMDTHVMCGFCCVENPLTPFVAPDAVNRCAKCQRTACQDCTDEWTECKGFGCSREYCRNCELESCDFCEDLNCESCFSQCNPCGRTMCDDCGNTCSGCQESFCSDCYYNPVDHDCMYELDQPSKRDTASDSEQETSDVDETSEN